MTLERRVLNYMDGIGRKFVRGCLSKHLIRSPVMIICMYNCVYIGDNCIV